MTSRYRWYVVATLWWIASFTYADPVLTGGEESGRIALLVLVPALSYRTVSRRCRTGHPRHRVLSRRLEVSAKGVERTAEATGDDIARQPTTWVQISRTVVKENTE